MISRTHRFHGRGAITRLYGNGKSVRARFIALRFAPNPKRRDYRVAVVVSKKVSKSAVVRNQIRRRVYERVRILSTSFNAVYDLIFTVYDEKVATMPPAELESEITRLCEKAGLTSVTTAQHDIVEPKE